MITMVLTGMQDSRVYDAQAHSRARAAMREVADGLSSQGMDILGQEWQEAHYLKASNVWGALCDATVGANGLFTWEYRPVGGAWTDPEQAAGMAMHLLGASSDAGAVPLVRFPGQSIKAAAGLRVRQHGLTAQLTEVVGDDLFLEVMCAVEVTNPDRPEHGRVLIRDNSVCWECRIVGAGQQCPGLCAAEIARIIGGSVPQLAIVNAARATWHRRRPSAAQG
jgi:hypothetical protein